MEPFLARRYGDSFQYLCDPIPFHPPPPTTRLAFMFHFKLHTDYELFTQITEITLGSMSVRILKSNIN